MADDIEKQIKLFFDKQHDREFDFQRYSHARTGLGHTGGHLKLKDWLHLQTGFSKAKDAVASTFNTAPLTTLCEELQLPAVVISSQANDAMQFLLRPDLGRLIASNDEIRLQHLLKQHPEYSHCDLLLVISGGLSSIAIEKQIPLFLPHFMQITREYPWRIAPIIINPKGRVALGDQLNRFFQARIVVMLIGERPGLTTPDSMGIYFTYNANPLCTDEQRNCISNIHAHGLSHQQAAHKLALLLNKSLASKISGVSLKDDALELK